MTWSREPAATRWPPGCGPTTIPTNSRRSASELDAERGYPARITCRVNDQRAMTMRADAEPVRANDVSLSSSIRQLTETSLTWLGRRDNMHEQVNILIEPQSEVVSLHMMWDRLVPIRCSGGRRSCAASRRWPSRRRSIRPRRPRFRSRRAIRPELASDRPDTRPEDDRWKRPRALDVGEDLKTLRVRRAAARAAGGVA